MVRLKTNKKFIKKLREKIGNPKNKDQIKKINTWKIEIEGLYRKGITIIQNGKVQKNYMKKG